MVVRPMRSSDAERVAALSTELGYPSSPSEIVRRFSLLAEDADHGLFVAEGPNGEAVGWVHVHGRRFLESDPFAEIGGLVVHENYRSQGVGRALMATAEHWALSKGYNVVCVRSNATRAEAHEFYRRIGYEAVKSQRVFRKSLNQTADEAERRAGA